ncbi:MAG TPA: FAD-dependent oxidoreductase [Ilumatobacteraceae bacterium]|nr:FAD-dependent oxidoreductase [Ilumatobacteraceae bacterium]
MTSNDHADAIVIGAGVIGASVALELARGGRRVIVVDKGPAAGAGSTSASASIIRFSYSTLDSVLTAWEAAAGWLDWAGHLGMVDPDGMARFVRTGIMIFRTPGDGTQRVEQLWDDVGIAYEVLDGDALRARLPGMDVGAFFPPKLIDDPAFADDPDGELSALFEPEAGFVDDPMLAARNLAHAAERHGAQFRFHTAVTGVERHDGRVSGVTIGGGEVIGAPVVVNVGGPHSSLLNRMAGVDTGMRIHNRALRQEMFTVEAPEGLRLDDGLPSIADMDIGQYIRPQSGGTWLVGGTEPACDELHWVDDPDHYDEHPTVERFEVSMMRLARRVPVFGVPHRPVGLAALYDVSDDWVPIYDKSDLPGWFMACGTSGNQFKNAPLAGRFMAAIIDADAAGHDHDEQPIGIVGDRTGRRINLGSFSRRRDRAVTSGTVMG